MRPLACHALEFEVVCGWPLSGVKEEMGKRGRSKISKKHTKWYSYPETFAKVVERGVGRVEDQRFLARTQTPHLAITTTQHEAYFPACLFAYYILTVFPLVIMREARRRRDAYTTHKR